ncbi:hypothetical protein GCK72_001659 [Caenorhabditis remanei]|uniref:Uncharacterized protein n=1 Tax=Caenorhabditis remanei TaxID=31234 RepID=A0A6A5HVQ7_CAERE|nr:hypothetical protein GCK72_001659 [Caenorhabditis remanei]KAF1769842.1 hypothetical protein GCK72_001659 [Caenorhabditis remanei]
MSSPSLAETSELLRKSGINTYIKDFNESMLGIAKKNHLLLCVPFSALEKTSELDILKGIADVLMSTLSKLLLPGSDNSTRKLSVFYFCKVKSNYGDTYHLQGTVKQDYLDSSEPPLLAASHCHILLSDRFTPLRESIPSVYRPVDIQQVLQYFDVPEHLDDEEMMRIERPTPPVHLPKNTPTGVPATSISRDFDPSPAPTSNKLSKKRAQTPEDAPRTETKRLKSKASPFFWYKSDVRDIIGTILIAKYRFYTKTGVGKTFLEEKNTHDAIRLAISDSTAIAQTEQVGLIS